MEHAEAARVLSATMMGKVASVLLASCRRFVCKVARRVVSGSIARAGAAMHALLEGATQSQECASNAVLVGKALTVRSRAPTTHLEKVVCKNARATGTIKRAMQ